MIAQNDLRIGNLVYYGESIRIITAVHDSPQRKCVGVDNMITEFSVIRPIPLTLEILQKAGFSFQYNQDGYAVYRNCIVDVATKDGKFWEWNEVGDYYYSFADVEIESVHDLQNFYYFGTNKEELKIEL